MALSACAPQASGPSYAPQPMAGGYAEPVPQRARVGLLLPLSGQNAALGQSLMNAAQLALFEQGAPGFEFVPRDTNGTPAGAAAAARQAIEGGARVLVGPLTAQETAAVAIPARAAGIPVLPFTNDANQAAQLVWPLGITPVQQVRRLVAAGQAQGVQRFALAAPDGALGRQMASALRSAASELNLPQPLIEFYPGAAQPGLVARDVAQKLALTAESPEAQRPGMLILGESGARARDMAAGLAAAGVAMPPLRLAGHALWGQDEGMGQQAALAGAWFPGPDPAARSAFESRYETAFGEKPARIVGVAYDAAAIAARAMRDGSGQVPVGEVIIGADGALRLNPGGQVQRGLAVYAIAPGAAPGVVAPAELPGSVGY
ncbi:penicillin-binding protein activator [Pseudoroseomonas cervicalis]|uniref:penicillin-binding protein activator n=1 Tax=Teichococcus cervicalis TaxID=204525 RepID=UPI0027827B6B|nr:penicillin-binding protein activator [Pseudoroseomonas cervicalis]MDQ1080537.1 branched-chain amino acid transport system substrate-binding protein [Pseudoroseomonas cervicalis]